MSPHRQEVAAATEATSCKHEGCDKPRKKAGYCHGHYHRKRKGKDMDAPIREQQSPYQRFWSKVRKSDACWEWQGYRDRAGYGQFGLDGGVKLAHRVAYVWHHGPIPEGMQVDHMCWNHSCVNPGHLRQATNDLNQQNLRGANRNSKSGVRGVHWKKASSKWEAQAKVGGQRYYLGRFDRIEDAHAAVTAWRQEHMPYSLMDRKAVGR